MPHANQRQPFELEGSAVFSSRKKMLYAVFIGVNEQLAGEKPVKASVD